MAYVYNYDNSLQQLSQVPELNSLPQGTLLKDPIKQGLLYHDPKSEILATDSDIKRAIAVHDYYDDPHKGSFLDKFYGIFPENIQDIFYDNEERIGNYLGSIYDTYGGIGPAISSGLASLGSNISEGLKSMLLGGSQASVYNSYDFSGLANAFKGLAETLGTTAAEANAMSQQSALDAMRFSASEAEKNRMFQQMIYNQSSAFNAAEAQKDREWQEYMSNTSYQRAVKDLRAAGLNPILAYHNGGASSGSGATASIGTLSGSQGSGYTANFKSDASAQDLFVNILQMLVGGITSLIGTGVGALTRILK